MNTSRVMPPPSPIVYMGRNNICFVGMVLNKEKVEKKSLGNCLVQNHNGSMVMIMYKSIFFCN